MKKQRFVQAVQILRNHQFIRQAAHATPCLAYETSLE
jgi:hypothetical protein